MSERQPAHVQISNSSNSGELWQIHVSGKIGLRPISFDDVSALHQLLKREHPNLQSFSDSLIEQNMFIETSMSFVAEAIAKFLDSGWPDLALTVDGKFSGMFRIDTYGATASAQSSAVEIGFWIAREFEGQGIMHQALTTLLSYLSSMSTAKVVILETAANNTRAKKLAARHGFKPFKNFDMKSTAAIDSAGAGTNADGSNFNYLKYYLVL